MKSMKGLSMSKMLGSVRRRPGSESPGSGAVPREGDSPETTAHNTVRAFCEAGGNVKGDEVLFLPTIVEAAESSPSAAAESARIIRKYLGKEYLSKSSWQYNGVMLVRILTDNPGQTFTRNLDQKFVDTVRSLLKHTKDRRVRQILMETLEDFQYTKMDDENLVLIIEMWKDEKEKAIKENGGQMPHGQHGPPLPTRPWGNAPPNGHSQNYFARSRSGNRLPDAVELASRLEEARTSAKLLEQVVMNTPPGEILSNDLIKEFADRCSSASRSIQGYMSSENPAPDNDTMENLIDTNEQLQTALNQHQRAVLSARKQAGVASPGEGVTPPPATNSNGQQPRDYLNGNSDSSGSGDRSRIARKAVGGDKGKGTTGGYLNVDVGASGSASASGSRSASKSREDVSPVSEDPFADPPQADAGPSGGSSSGGALLSGALGGSGSGSGSGAAPPRSSDISHDDGHDDLEVARLAFEPFNPGFNQAKGKAKHDPAFGDASEEDLYGGPGKEKQPADE